MSHTQDLQDRIATLKLELKSTQGRAEAIVARADRERRELTATEGSDCDRLHRRFDQIEDEITNLTEEWGSTPLPRVVPPQPIGNQRQGSYSPTGPQYANLFRGAAPDSYAGRFSSFGDFARSVAAGGTDARLVTNAAMGESSGTAGGFLVPSVWASQLFDDALQLEAIRPRCRVIGMDAPSVNVPVFDNEDGTSNARGGLTLQWLAEAGTATQQAGKTRTIALTAKKAAVFVRVSSELAFDVPNFDAQLSSAMSAALAAGIDAACVKGTGAGTPLGLLNSACMISVAKVATQGTNTLTLQNLADCVGSLAPGSFKTAIWLVSPSCIPSLLAMAYTVMNIAGAENVGGSYVPAVTFDASGAMRIFGKEALVSDACSTKGAVGDVILFDPQRYLLGVRKEMSLERDVSPYWGTDEQAYRCIIRMDAQSLNSVPQKLSNGSTTVSPIVTVASRA